ncbi:C40 family peptidase [Ectopseudomonas guguanensis]|jgi:cell wall-associated NlpC family hydrolase|uniref:C40 family peptidase n=1 Tax=Ectopseudomonas guguanensis TaxID=1198456 RepID=UPI0012D62B45|nr:MULTISPECIES: NlpC/P60 family protein [Pseudomonas]MPT19058.1 peptidoglycan endopeptidase [Pseudomonas sp.]WJH56410.1 peptidoglycan endopeptidase [Pseudomonas guguanensis]
MLKRFAPLVPLALTVFLAACAGHSAQPQISETKVEPVARPLSHPVTAADDEINALIDDKPYEMPQLADSLLDLGRSLIGTRYRYGGNSVQSGFDCSGFVGYLFREEVGLELPRSTRELINLDAPKVARADLEPGDLILFNDRGRGRVSHAGIYLGDDQFIHSSSSRSGGVRIDSLDDSYWNRSYLQAKRVLALAPVEDQVAAKRHN